jgi:hypothetical protein
MRTETVKASPKKRVPVKAKKTAVKKASGVKKPKIALQAAKRAARKTVSKSKTAVKSRKKN